jgi:pimeloyl-ACP methyl ester carboxylesterase
VSERTPEGIVFEVAGDGPALLLMHAGIADRSMWDPQWHDWAERFTLIRYDHRGLGESADPAPGWSIHGDAGAVLDAAGIERTLVLGASMGGRGALDLALESPERAAALVTIASTPSGWQHDADLLARFEQIEAAYERAGIEAANELELDLWIDGGRDPGELDPRFREQVSVMNRAALEREEAIERSGLEAEQAELDPPASERLSELESPLLVVTGELDVASVNAGSALLAARVPGAEAVEIAGATHLPSLERPEQFEAAVLPFLERHA